MHKRAIHFERRSEQARSVRSHAVCAVAVYLSYAKMKNRTIQEVIDLAMASATIWIFARLGLGQLDHLLETLVEFLI